MEKIKTVQDLNGSEKKKRGKIPISFMPVVKIWGPLLKLVLIHMGPGVKGKNK